MEKVNLVFIVKGKSSFTVKTNKGFVRFRKVNKNGTFMGLLNCDKEVFLLLSDKQKESILEAIKVLFCYKKAGYSFKKQKVFALVKYTSLR